MGNKQSTKSQQATAAPPPGPQPHYSDHLTRRRQHWPLHIDGRALTCAEVAADIRRSCDYIAHARAFGIRWLHQQLQQRLPPQPFPLRLTRALHAAPEAAGGAGACVYVTAAVRVRVRCSEVARFASNLATNCKLHQRARDRCRWGESIIARVHSGHCKAVQVPACQMYLSASSLPHDVLCVTWWRVMRCCN